MLERVISGGQTGADRAGLMAARAAGLATGGWMPRGFRADDGPHPDFLTLYGLLETESSRYPPRTAKNVRDSDGTLRFASQWHSPGELLTLKLCRQYRKPYYDVTVGDEVSVPQVSAWLTEHKIRVLNIAGNSERTSPGIFEWTLGFLDELFRLIALAVPAG